MSDDKPGPDPSIQYLGDVQRLALNAGDILVLSLDGPISVDEANALRSHLDLLLPGQPVLILERGMKVGVLGPD